jgi:hypothetical protein
MAFTATTIWEVEHGGSDTANGGGFDPGNSNMATDLAATSGNTASPVVSSASYNFANRDIGAWVFIQAGTSWIPGWYQIASVASNKATLTAGIGTAPLWGSSTGACLMNSAAGVATVASPSSGTWSIDYSQQGSPGISYTDIAVGGTATQYTSAGNPVGPNVVGNVISVTSGSGFSVQYVQVLSQSGGVGTVDKSFGGTSLSGGQGGLGGALATHGFAGSLIVAGNWCFMQYNATPYTQTSASNNVAGGSMHLTVGGTGGTIGNLAIIGYATNRHYLNTDANRPILRAGVNSATGIYVGGQFGTIRQLSFDNPSAFTSCIACQVDFSYWWVDLVSVSGYSRSLYGTDAEQTYTRCYVTGSGNTGIVSGNGALILGCVVASSSNGIAPGILSTVENCVVTGINGSSVYGFSINGTTTMKNCVAYNVTGSANIGFTITSTANRVFNCVAVNCTGHGFDQGGSFNAHSFMFNCAAYNCGTNVADFTACNNLGFITLSAEPFANPGSNDFTLNGTAGGGASLKAAEWPSSLPVLTGTNYGDVGAYQSQTITTTPMWQYIAMP